MILGDETLTGISQRVFKEDTDGKGKAVQLCDALFFQLSKTVV